jgi:hypothetical protein
MGMLDIKVDEAGEGKRGSVDRAISVGEPGVLKDADEIILHREKIQDYLMCVV